MASLAYRIATPGTNASGKTDFVLFTTSDLASGRIIELQRLLSSIKDAVVREGLRVRHYILLQRSAGVPTELTGDDMYSPCVLTVDGNVSLSRARNLLLHRAREEGALARTVWVGFPDDDAWYPPDILREVTSLLVRRGELDMLICRYGSNTYLLGKGRSEALFRKLSGARELIRTVSSITMLMRASVVMRTGFFDERLGVGAEINGGEDLDYALRAYSLFVRKALITQTKLVGHRDRVVWVRSRYFAGSLFALARTARMRPRFLVEVARKVAVGAALVALREMTIKDLLHGLRIGLAGWQELEPKVEPCQWVHAKSV